MTAASRIAPLRDLRALREEITFRCDWQPSERVDLAAVIMLFVEEGVSEANKELVRQYFAALDSRVPGAANAMFAPDAIIHRSDVPEPIVGREGMQRFSE